MLDERKVSCGALLALLALTVLGLMGSGPVTDMGHLYIKRQGNSAYVFDLHLPRWVAKDVADVEWADKVGSLDQRDANRLFWMTIGRNSACSPDTHCKWENPTAIASYDIVRVGVTCRPRINQKYVCLESPLPPKVPESFFIDGNLETPARWVFFRVDRNEPRFAFEVGSGLVPVETALGTKQEGDQESQETSDSWTLLVAAALFVVGSGIAFFVLRRKKSARRDS